MMGLPSLANAWDFLRSIYHREHWWAEFWSGLVLTNWAMADFISNSPITVMPRYAVLIQIMPNYGGELLALGIGLQQLVALLLNHTLYRFLAAAEATWFFAVLVMSITYDGSGSPPAGVVLVIGWLALNLFASSRELGKLDPFRRFFVTRKSA